MKTLALIFFVFCVLVFSVAGILAFRSSKSPVPVETIEEGESIRAADFYLKTDKIDADTLQSHPAGDFLLLSDYSQSALTLSGLPVSSFLRSDTSDYLTGTATKLYLSTDASSQTYYISASGDVSFKSLSVSNLNTDTLDNLSGEDFLRANTSDYLQGTDTKLYLDVEADNTGRYISSAGDAVLGDLTSNTLYIGDSATLAENVKLYFDSTDTYIYASTDEYENLVIGADQDIIVEPDGNVGIGTGSPSKKLQVAGDIYTEDNLYVGSTSETLANTGFILDGNDLFVAGMTGIEGNIYTDGSFIAGSSTTYGDNSIAFSGAATINLAASQTQALNIESGLLNLDTSNSRVGIGTTAPSALLSIGSSSQFQVNSSGYALLPGGAVGTPALSFTGDTNTGFYRTAADKMAWVTGGSERITVDSSGNVGIGTTSPAYSLDISGPIRTSNRFYFSDGDTSLERRLIADSNGTVSSYQKISDTQGGFTGTIDGDWFGVHDMISSLGDLDGDGVGDLAVGSRFDDDGGTDHGAVWILFLNTDGTVKSHQKISDTEGNFTGVLDNDYFGISTAFLSDLDGDGVGDLAVGAELDDDGGTDRGAVWILFLNTNGTVKSHQKISDTEGSFTGTLDDMDAFGASLASLGDLDGDGVEDLAVGAPNDGDGGAYSGAVWILFLNTDGTVKSHQKISDTEGSFTGTLDDMDAFGESVDRLGDLNGDGVEDLAVGAPGDDDGNDNNGAIYVLFLNPTTDTSSNLSFLTEGKEGMILTQQGRLGLGVDRPLERLHLEGNAIFDGGNIGIGATNPGGKMHVHDAVMSSGDIALKIDTNDVGAADEYFIKAISDADGTPDTEFYITTTGAIYADDGTLHSPADVAELYPTSDSSITAGDVVRLKGAGEIEKADKPYDPKVLGVISEKPAVTMGYDPDDPELANKKPIALVGKVSIKVTGENGPIVAGDYLTASPTPGYAMRATERGMIIGIAIEDYDFGAQKGDTEGVEEKLEAVKEKAEEIVGQLEERVEELDDKLATVEDTESEYLVEGLSDAKTGLEETIEMVKTETEESTQQLAEEEGKGRILMFVNLSWWGGEENGLLVEGGVLSPSEEDTKEKEGSLLSEIAYWSRDSLWDWLLDKFKQIGILIEEGLLKVKELKAEKLCLGETCVTEEELKQLLENRVEPSSTVIPPE